VVKHYPYAPYIMYIIEHVSGIHFPIDNPHKVLKLSNKLSLQAKRELEEAAKGKGKRQRCFRLLLTCFSTAWLSHLSCS
jgi:hypothetical protein